MDRRDEQLPAVASEAQRRIIDAMAHMAASEIKGSRFDQAGLRDGLETVQRFLRAGELGIAFEHVCYTVEETEIPLSSTSAPFPRGNRRGARLRIPRVLVAD
jgi:hypothetical protein